MGHIIYYRYSPWKQLQWEGESSLPFPVLICDVLGERGLQGLRERIVGSPRIMGASVVLRGLSQPQREDIQAQLYDADLKEVFSTATDLWDLVVTPTPRLVHLYVQGETGQESEALLAAVRQAELNALLDWSGGIWSPKTYHYALPSGEHADHFIRVADAFASTINVDRIVDWLSEQIPSVGVILIDSPTMLPLAQALQLRVLRENPCAETSVRILPVYAFPPERTSALMAELARWCSDRSDQGARVMSVVSVSASGGYIRRLQKGFSEVVEPPDVTYAIICSTGEPQAGNALCHINVETHKAADCDLGTTIGIEQQSFSTRVLVGVERTPLPNYEAVTSNRALMGSLADARAFAVHVDRPQHGHLSILVRTQAMLSARVARAAFDSAFANATTEWRPDIIVLPRHDGTASLRSWLQTVTDVPVGEVRLGDGCDTEVLESINAAGRILLLDDALISSHTMRALHEEIQRQKQSAGKKDYRVRGLVLLAREAYDRTLKGMRSRFRAEDGHGFWSALQMPLPDIGHAGRGTCPWCNEARYLAAFLPKVEGPARDYINERLRRLQDPQGLSGALFLLSDSETTKEREASVKTTPGSFLGDISDVGAYVSMATLVQSVRRGWKETPGTHMMQRVVSLQQPLRYYTDTVIASAILRTIRPGELWAPETEDEIKSALFELEHVRQHPVLAAEILFGISRKVLPTTLESEQFVAPHRGDEVTGSVLRELQANV